LRKKKIGRGTHTAPDFDVVSTFYLEEDYGGLDPKQTAVIFLKGGDESLTGGMMGDSVVLIDRGRGGLDHHGRNFNDAETSASLMAKKLGITEDKNVQALLGLAKRKDLQGVALPCDAPDIVSCIQKTRDLSDEEKLRLGIRIVRSAMEFRKRKLQRDNRWGQKVCIDFLAERKPDKIPEKFSQYIDKLQNEGFNRPFDIVEILVGEKAQFGEEEAVRFVKTLLGFVFNDSIKFYQAKQEFRENAAKKEIKGILMTVHCTDNEKFNPAARSEGASIIVQRDTDGHTQIFFSTEDPLLNDSIIDSIAAMVRLEECLVQGNTIPDVDLAQSEWVDGIAEWYYYKAPPIGGKKPGRFIMNGSLTAPDVPCSHIPLSALFEIVQKAVIFNPNFDWERWMRERASYYISKRKTIST
jgi:hypothetical protein